jgi:hypothetical protein
MQRAPWSDTIPAPAPLTPEQQARLHRFYSSECSSECSIECADEDDYARNVESEDGRDDTGPRIGLLLLAFSAVLVCVVAAHVVARFTA